MRQRRRERRGPLALPGPLSPSSVPVHRGPREEFDALVQRILDPLEKHFAAEPDPVEVVVEDIPLLPPDWDEEVPLSTVSMTADGARVVLYRRPLGEGCTTRDDLEDRVWDVVLHRLAEVWQVSPDDLDPR